MVIPSIPIPDTLKGGDDLIRSGLEGFRESWFAWLLVSTAVVVAGLLFEAPEIWHETVEAIRGLCHSPKPKRDIPAWMKLVGTVGWVLIVVGVTGEFVADSFVSKADGFVQKFDEILLADAQTKTGAASERAASAFERAAQTEREASQANERAAKSLAAAEIARKDAEGFQLQIAQANERAAHAEQRAAEATLELTRLKSPRSLNHIPELVTALEIFKGTEYTFSSVFSDEESINLLKEIDRMLKRAGWKRVKPPGGYPAINVYGKDDDFPVPSSLGTGVQISVDSSVPFASVQSMQLKDMPPYMRAAIALNLNVSANLFPPQEGDPKTVNVESGTSTTVRISVGKKP